jgi:hypothetical protein
MPSRSRNASGAAALAALAAAVLGAPIRAAADDPPTPFSQAVQQLTGDWESEDWREGTLKLHPQKYTWQSDIHVTLYPEEPAAGRTALAVAKLYFEGYSLDDDTLRPTRVSMADAREIGPGIVMTTEGWYYIDNNVSFFGVVTTADGNFIPFHSNCEDVTERFDPKYDYPFDECTRQISLILIALSGRQGARLTMPPAPAPFTMPGWREAYLPSGNSVATRSSLNGLRSATIMITPPRAIAQTSLPGEITAFSSTLIDDDDRVQDHPGTAQWVGSAADPWVRRQFPEAFDGPSIIMAGSAALPDGRTSLIGVRCPNEHWLEACARGVEVAKQQAATGIMEQRRLAIVAASKPVLPANGLKTADVFGIYTKGRNTMGYGGFMTGFEVDGPLLLKDGTACTCFEGPLGGIVPGQSRAANPKDWGTWRKAGNAIVVTINGDTETYPIEPRNAMIGGTPKTRIEGEFQFVSGGGMIGSGSGWLNQSYVSFFPDGTFSNTRSSAFNVTAGNPVDPVGSVVGGSQSGGNMGRYEIDGFNLKLTFPDGRIMWRGFAQYAHEAGTVRKSAVMIDGTVYFRTGDD